MKVLLKHTGSTFLLALLLLQLSAFHVYEEHDNLNGQENHCDHCLLAIENQQLDSFVLYSFIVGDIYVEPIGKHVINKVDIPVILSPYKKEQLPRPPPRLL